MEQQFFRRHARVRDFDYRSNFAYFITIVTGGRESVFGSVHDGILQPTQRGLIAARCWQNIPQHHPFVELDAIVVMPNHIHGVLLFAGNDTPPVAATFASPSRNCAKGPAQRSLGAVVGSFKSTVSREINRLRAGAAAGLWQPNYYEHVIRDDRALDAIRDYIVTNPGRWEHDGENPAGDGGDDFLAFVRSIDLVRSPREATQASQLREVGDGGRFL